MGKKFSGGKAGRYVGVTSIATVKRNTLLKHFRAFRAFSWTKFHFSYQMMLNTDLYVY
jgi:hypothetical protein